MPDQPNADLMNPPGADSRDQILPVSIQSTDISRTRAWVWLLLILVWAGVWRGIFVQGWAGADDSVYVICANALSQGEQLTIGDQPLMDHRAARASYITAVALWMGLLGRSDAVLCSLDVLCGVASLAALYWVGTLTIGRRVGLWAAGLKSVYPTDLVYNGLLFPDHFGQFFSLLAMGSFLSALKSRSKSALVWVGVGGIAFATAVSARENAFLLGIALPLVGLISAGKRGLKLGILLGAAGLAAFALDFVVLHAATGDWLYRFNATGTSFGKGGLHYVQPLTWGKMLYYPFVLLIGQTTTGIYGWLLIAGLLWAWSRRRCYSLVLVWTVMIWLFMEFGSTSPTSYQPLPKGIRLMAPITVLLFIPLGEMAVTLAGAMRRARWAFYAAVAGLVFHGLFTANHVAQPLYWADQARSVRAAIALQSHGDCPPLMLPQDVFAKLSPEKQASNAQLERIDLSGRAKDLPTAGSLLFAARRHSLVIPRTYFKVMRIHARHGRVGPDQLEQYLDTHAEKIPLIDRRRPLDRMLLRIGAPRLSAEHTVGHIYILGKKSERR